ncbi:MAG: hypothetical protein ACK47B_19530 [Armatimonadota bacterium]
MPFSPFPSRMMTVRSRITCGGSGWAGGGVTAGPGSGAGVGIVGWVGCGIGTGVTSGSGSGAGCCTIVVVGSRSSGLEAKITIPNTNIATKAAITAQNQGWR